MNAGTPAKCSNASKPRLDLLVEADPGELMARVTQHHDEHMGLTQSAFGGIVEVADVTEVDLRFLSGVRLQRDRDVLRAHAALAPNGTTHALDRGDAASELRMLLPNRARIT